MCQESHYVSALDSPLEPRIKVEKSRARNSAAPTLKGLRWLPTVLTVCTPEEG